MHPIKCAHAWSVVWNNTAHSVCICMTLYRNVYYAQQIIIVKFVCLKGSLCWQGRAWRHSLILEQCYKIMKSINRWSFWPSDSPSMHVKSNPHRTWSDTTSITFGALSTIVWYSLDYEFIKSNPAVGLPLPKWGKWAYLQCIKLGKLFTCLT